MSEEKKKYIQHTTGKGIAKFCHLNKPNDKFKAQGEYSVDLTQTPEEAKPLIELIDNAMKESVAQAKKDNPKLKTVKVADKPYKKDVDQDGNETGLLKFKFKAAASGVRKKDQTPWTFKPALFDAKGKPLPASVQVWGGSVVKVAFEMMPFYTAQVGAGVSLRLKAVKVLDLKTGGNRDAASYGFGDEDEGYEYSESADQQEAAAAGAEAGTPDF